MSMKTARSIGAGSSPPATFRLVSRISEAFAPVIAAMTANSGVISLRRSLTTRCSTSGLPRLLDGPVRVQALALAGLHRPFVRSGLVGRLRYPPLDERALDALGLGMLDADVLLGAVEPRGRPLAEPQVPQ